MIETNISIHGQKTAERATKKSLYLLAILLFISIAGIVLQQIQIFNLSTKVNKLQYVYVYDLEETLKGLRVDDLNREFEAKINILNDEVSSAQEKIAEMKNGKLKDDFAEVYLKSLKFKRDSMIQEYTKSIQNITESINAGLVKYAKQKGITVVFDKRAVAGRTSSVIDVTPELIEKISFNRPAILDN